MVPQRSTTDTAEADERTANGESETHADEILPETVNLGVPASANRGETAAIAAAVGAHLHDRAAAETADTTEQCNRWKLCGRLGGRMPPRTVARGEEWKAAARSRW